MSNEKLIIHSILRDVKKGEYSVECATLKIKSVISDCRRDQFAIAALKGLLASGPHDCTQLDLVYKAYAYAHDMMQEREK